MDQPVALEVQVKTLRCHVGGNQDPDRGPLLPERLYHLLGGPDVCLNVTPVDPRHLLVGEAEIRRRCSESHATVAIPSTEYGKVVPRVSPGPAQVPQELQEILVLAERPCIDRGDLVR